MSQVTRDDVIKMVGPIDDVAIAEIIGTSTTLDELAQAQAWFVNDEPLINAGKPLPSGRVGELIAILSDLGEDQDEERDGGPAVGGEG